MSVQEALTMVADPPELDVATIKAEVARLDKARKVLLPVEQKAYNHILNEIRPLADQIAVYEFWLKHRYPIVSKEVLSWRWDETITVYPIDVPLPRLALVSVSSRNGVMEIRNDTRSVLPFPLTERYDDVSGALRDLRERTGRLRSLFFHYAGVIPDETRDKIKEAMKVFAHQEGVDTVYLLCDAPAEAWVLGQQTPAPELYDPLVVGIKHGEMWLIGSFDPTPVEDYISKEFTTAPAPAPAPTVESAKRKSWLDRFAGD